MRKDNGQKSGTRRRAEECRIEERESILREFMEWHLNTWFVPFDPTTAIHVARWQGFLGGARRYTAILERASGGSRLRS